MGQSGSRIIRRNDLRSSLISKRTAPAIRSREYIKKIKQARMKLSESSFSKSKATEDPETPPKENRKEQDDNDDEDFLDVANDVLFEEEDDNIAKRSSKAKSEEKDKHDDDKEEEEADKTISDKLNASGTSASDERSRRARSEKSSSKEGERSVDLNCIHCMTKCASLDVSCKRQSSEKQLINNVMQFHRIIGITCRVVLI